jgi:hypothetical protein
MHVKGYAAPETKGAIEQARVFIEQSEALGEPAEDPLLLFSALYGVWVVSYVAFNGDICRDLAAQFLTLAEKKRATGPLLMAHAIMGHTSLNGGDFNKAGSIMTRGLRFTIQVNIGPWRRGLVKTFRLLSCPIAHWPCGSSVFPRPHSKTLKMLLSMAGTRVKLLP